MEGLGLSSDLLAIVAIGSAAALLFFFFIYAYLKARKARQLELSAEEPTSREISRTKQPDEAKAELPEPPVDQPATPAPTPTAPQPQREGLPPPSALREAPLLEEKPAPQPKVEPAEKVPAPQKQPRPSSLSPGLSKTRSGWIAKLGQVFAGKREIDPSLLEEIERVLLTSDIGVKTSQMLIEEIKTSLSKKEISSPESVWNFLKKRSREVLTLESEPVDFKSQKPFVLLVVGVNGSGKTTTIGKLAAQLTGSGLKVLLAAGDTFRAAASEQLEIWGQRSNSKVVRGKEGADPSSVLFEGIKQGLADGVDVVIGDTAGRLHTKTDLMQELQKAKRVVAKACPGAPHETWLVIDATSGQNAIAQAQIFAESMDVSGVVLTKLDGTAKGGVILGIADQLRLPVRYIGIGEKTEDLRPFDPEEFVDALFEGTTVLS